ncbi:hypothetical protein SDC9_32067 [bioreactor metagenome]|uniref:Uncharacterized protein n=1 Tax=bioreactor metagenome TaxID=1076179 RepID=A0A644V4H5_9ZZZZ
MEASLHKAKGGDGDVDRLDPEEGHDQPAQPVDRQVAPQQRCGARGLVFHPAQRERDQRDDDQRVEDHRRQKGALRRGEPHDVQNAQPRKGGDEDRRQDGEVLRHVIGDREGGQRAARDQQLLAHHHHLDQLGRIAVEVDQVRRLLRGGRARVHRHPHIRLRQRGRVVRAVAAHRDQPPARLFAADVVELHLGRRFGKEVVHPRLGGDCGGGQGIVTGDHHRADAHRAQLGKALAHAGLDHVLQMDRAEDHVVLRHQKRRAAGAGDLVDPRAQRRIGGAPDEPLHRIHRALAQLPARQIDAGKPGLGGEGDGLAPFHALAGQGGEQPARQIDDRLAFRRGIAERGKPGGTDQLRLDHAMGRIEGLGHPVAEGDRAGLVKQQRVHIPRRLDRTPGFGDDIGAHQPVHAGDADGRQKPADGGGDQRHEQRRKRDDRDRDARIAGEGGERDHDEKEDQRQPGKEDVQRDLVRGLLPLRPLDQRDHPVEEALARLGGDLQDQAVGNNPGAAGDRTAVAAGFADDGCAFAGDRAFVDRGDAADHLGVGRDQVSGLDAHELPGPQRRGRHRFRRRVVLAGEQPDHGFGLGCAQAVGAGLAAAFGERLGEIGEEDADPEPEGHLKGHAPARRADGKVAQGEHAGQPGGDGGDEDHRVAHQGAGAKLAEGGFQRRRIKARMGGRRDGHGVSLN